ncbi:craniofacial development protein 2-like [Scylla paramamosain]|uniref:craniofacial development protein 2-like n=1 Tax=Scylla paramamosain TaxID=85552 RepID=UPI0030836FE3
MRIINESTIPDRSLPGLPTSAYGAVPQQGAGGQYVTVGRRRRGGRVRKKQERRKDREVEIRVGSLNVGTMTGKGRKLAADMMEKRKIDVLCVQETKWRGSKGRLVGGGCKLFYYGLDGKRNGTGVIVKEKYINSVLEVKRVSDRVMSLKMEIEGIQINVISAYAPQVGCELDEKEFWSEVEEVIQDIPREERIVIGPHFNGHIGEGNNGDEDVMGKYGVGERNAEGQMVVDCAKRMEIALVKTYFKKREEHRVTYMNGGRSTQVDFILCRRCNLKEFSDCKVVPGESVARQHRVLIGNLSLKVKARRKVRTEPKIKWWKLKEEEYNTAFKQEERAKLW